MIIHELLRRALLVFSLTLAVSFSFAISDSSAQESDADYFHGKTIEYWIGSKPGGGYDRYSRLIAPYLEKYLPGSRVLPVNRPAGAGIAALNDLYAANPDGLTVMTMNTGLLLSQIGEREGIAFDMAKLDWIGKAGAGARILVIHTESGIDDFAGLLQSTEPVIFAASGYGGMSYVETKLIKNAFNINARVLPGFGGNESEAALAKGEVHGLITSESNVPPMVEAGYVKPILRFGEPLIDSHGTIESAENQAQTEDQKLVTRRIFIMCELGRMLATAPETPAPILAALRSAYEAALKDPQFLTEAQRQGLPIAFRNGEEVAVMVSEFLEPVGNYRALVKTALIPD